MYRFLTAMVTAATVVLSASAASAVTLTPGFDATLMSDETVGARYRGESFAAEHFVGVNNLRPRANRSAANYAWEEGRTNFLFTFDSADGMISSTLGDQTLTYGGPAGLVSDVLRLMLFDRSSGSASFGITNLMVNGDTVGDLNCRRRCNWMVTGYSVAPVLTVSGTIDYAGVFGPTDARTMRFEITSNAITPVPLPAAGWMLLAGLGGLVLLGRRRAGAAPEAL